MSPAPLLLGLTLALPAAARGVPDAPMDDMGRSTEDSSLRDATLACLILADDDCAAGADAARTITRESRGVRTAPPVFGTSANFERLSKAYPHGSVEEVRTMIGRAAEGWIQNTCAIRVSFALNNAGVADFRVDRSLLGPEKRINFITDKSGAAAGHVYVYRVDEFANYMLKKYGKPQVWASRPDNLRTAVWGKKGIILFVVSGWNDATGHFDLWDGEKAAHEQYFDKASDVFLWQ